MSIKSRFTDEPLWLMDGSAFVFRAFYASQAMTRSDGMPTGALYIVARIILRILREEQPRQFVFMLDGRGKNFRHEAFAAYKANRSATPEGLVQQMEPIQRFVKALGIHLEVSQGCEADDCIASLAARYSSSRPVVIIGADKDLRQCLNERVIMWDPAAKNEKIVTLESFTAETGLAPDQWPDMQALIGDSSDNIPGIPGIGPKTAEKIMRDYPRLEAIRDGFAQFDPSLKKKFENRLEDMFLYRELTRLRTNCCPGLDLESMRLGPVNVTEAEAILSEFELPSIQRELASMVRSGMLAASGSATASSAVTDTRSSSNTRQLSLLDAAPGDSAPVSPPDDLPVYSTPTDLPDSTGQNVALLADQSTWLCALAGHSLRYAGSVRDLIPWLKRARRIIAPDVKKLWKEDFAWRELSIDHWHDLGLASYLIDPEEGDVSWLRLLSRFSGLPSAVTPAPASQVVTMLALAEDMDHKLHGAHLTELLAEMEMPLIPVLADMELAGVQLDQAVLADFLSEVQSELSRLTHAVYEAAGDAAHDLGGTAFNIRSAQQLGVLLFDRLGLPRSGKTQGGQPRTDQEALEKLQGKHPIIDALLAYRKLEKMRSTYLEPLPRLMGKDGRIRTTFNQAATATGRLSSSNPNLQNIPIRGELGRRMRTCFTAAPGNVLVSADYSQIDLRVLAHLSQEPTLISAFREGIDIHARTAGLLFNKTPDQITPDERRNAKTINFGLVYGMGPQSLAKSLGITMNEAKTFIAQYFTHMSRLKQFYEDAEQLAKDQGFVTTMAGRRRLLPDVHSDNNQIRSQARRQAINTMVQGSAADIIKLAMLAVYNDEPLRAMHARLLLQVHDELLLEVPEAQARDAAARVAELMASVKPGGVALDVPLIADAGVGRNWGEAH